MNGSQSLQVFTTRVAELVTEKFGIILKQTQQYDEKLMALVRTMQHKKH